MDRRSFLTAAALGAVVAPAIATEANATLPIVPAQPSLPKLPEPTQALGYERPAGTVHYSALNEYTGKFTVPPSHTLRPMAEFDPAEVAAVKGFMSSHHGVRSLCIGEPGAFCITRHGIIP